jgi:hypothetical protein
MPPIRNKNILTQKVDYVVEKKATPKGGLSYAKFAN